MHPVSYKQMYLWKKKSLTNMPWDRQNFNVDFLKYEQQRIQQTNQWYTTFQKVKYGESLPEECYYLIPIYLNSNWKAAIATKGNFKVIGLSALKNCLQFQILMLYPSDKKLPSDYSLVKITNGKKDYIHNEKTNLVKNIIIAEEFEEQDPVSVYIDVPYESKPVLKFIKENLIT